MSKIMKLTQEHIDDLRKSFEEALATGKFSDGKFTFSKDLGKLDRRATVWFTPIAWCKQTQLVSKFDKEVAWHGIAKRGEEPDTFVIEDILVYPQEVTGSTVTTDQVEYQTWLMNHEDEVFNNIRYQGHSHVNMGTSPSAVDTTLYDSILAQLEDGMFYIFMIWNKKDDKTIKIYDLRENVFFDTTDVKVGVIGLEGFMDDAKGMVKEHVYTPPKTVGNSGYGNYGSYMTPASASKTKKEEVKTTGATLMGYRTNPKASGVGVYGDFDDDEYDVWKSPYRYY